MSTCDMQIVEVSRADYVRSLEDILTTTDGAFWTRLRETVGFDADAQCEHEMAPGDDGAQVAP